MRHPDFMIIGAAKSGTTSLHEYLSRHSRVFLAEPKEPEYFSRQDVYARGLSYYSSLFERCPLGALAGEGSTTYTRWPHTLDSSRLISQDVTTAKFVYILRDPVRRAYSHYQHHMRYQVTMSFEEALAADEIYFDCGNYIMQIERYLRYFPKSSIHVCFNEELSDNPDSTLRGVQEFLGLPYEALTKQGVSQRNRNADDHYLRHKTTLRLRRIPGVSAVINRIPTSVRAKGFHWLRSTRMAKRIASQHHFPPLTDSTRKVLQHRYALSIRKLEEFIGKRITWWG